MKKGQRKMGPIIGLPLSSLYDPYQVATFNGVYEQAKIMDARLFCFSSSIFSHPDTSGDMLYDLISTANIDALILISGCFGEDLSTKAVRSFIRKYAAIPAVSTGIKVPETTSIIIDNQKGMKSAITHLITGHGCKRIAFIKGPGDNDEANIRFNVYRRCLKEHNIPYDPKLVCFGNYQDSAGYEAVATLLDKRKVSFDALASVNDISVHAAMETLKIRGYAIPDDIKVVGFDDIDKSRSSSPGLTTVRQPLFECGSIAVQKAIELLNGKKVPKTIILPSKLIVRQSCGRPQHEMPELTPPEKQKRVRKPVTADSVFKVIKKNLLKDFTISHSQQKARYILGLVYRLVKWLEQAGRTQPPEHDLRDLITELVMVMARMNFSISPLEHFFTIIFREVSRLAGDHEHHEQLNSIWRRVNLLIYKQESYLQSIKKFNIEKETDMIRIASDQLLSCFNYTEITGILVSFLPVLGIHECYAGMSVKTIDKIFEPFFYHQRGGERYRARSCSQYMESLKIMTVL